jgi:thiamine-monophosphate kinase
MRGEDRLTAWLSRQAGTSRLLGDDAAFLSLPGDVAVTVDSQIEGVHFLPGLAPERIARRLLAVNLSDLAACGARPAYAFLALNAPGNLPHRRFLSALLRAARAAGIRLAGGDLASAPAFAATLTLVGTRPRSGRWVRRDQVRAGDRLWVGGTLGEAAAGLLLQRSGGTLAKKPAPLARAARRAVTRHLLPTPQLELGAWLGRRRRAAALDISDGLARDLHRLCRASGVGAVINGDGLPIADGFSALCAALGANPMQLALTGGEDYILLFALPADVVPPPRFNATAIGIATAGRGVTLNAAGKSSALPDRGFDHLQ